MILKKPYAFLIKHFRLIHLLIFATILGLYYNMQSLYNFFASLQRTGTYSYVGASSHINNSVYLFGLIGIILCGIIYFLFKFKKKDTKLYFYSIIYILIMFFAFWYLYSQLTFLETRMFKIEEIIRIKDIALIMTVPSYVIMLICILRGIGFNIKKFNFNKDIEELNIASQDSEEFEVLIGKNNYKYTRFLRRSLREFKYYVKENSFSISVILGIVILLAGVYIVSYIIKYNFSTGQNNSTMINNIVYTVKDSYITKYDYYGNEVKKGYKYVIVDLELFTYLEDTTLPLETIYLSYDNFKYPPALNYNSKFYDLGIPYNKEKLIENDVNKYTLTFEIPASVKRDNFVLKIETGLNKGTDEIVTSNYHDFFIKAQNLDDGKINRNIGVGDVINSNVVNHNKFDMTITNLEITDTFIDKYVLCYSKNNCNTISSLVSATSIDASKTLMVVSYKGSYDQDSYLAHKFISLNNIYSNIVSVNYNLGGTTFDDKVTVLESDEINDKIFLLVNRQIKKSKDVSLVFHFRTGDYIVHMN